MSCSKFTLAASGSGKALPFFVLGFVTRMQSLTAKQIYHQHESEKKRMHASRVLEVEQGFLTPLVFTTTGGMADECNRYLSRLAELLSAKKGEDYSTTMSCFIVLRDIWFVSSTGQTCPEGRSTNRTRAPMRGAPPYPIQTRKTRPQHRELHALLFTTSVRVLLRPTGL